MREHTQSGAPEPKPRPERARREHPNQGAQHSSQLQSLFDHTLIHLSEKTTVITYSVHLYHSFSTFYSRILDLDLHFYLLLPDT